MRNVVALRYRADVVCCLEGAPLLAWAYLERAVASRSDHQIVVALDDIAHTFGDVAQLARQVRTNVPTPLRAAITKHQIIWK